MTEKRLAAAIALLVLAAVVVPFAFLSNVQRLNGAFLFWALFAAVIIALIAWATVPWKRER